MTCKHYFLIFSFSIALSTAAGQNWKNKPVPEWSEEDVKQILTDSPWTKKTPPSVERPAAKAPGSGMGGRRMGGRGGGVSRDPGAGSNGTAGGSAPTVTVRWESALPVQEAHLKSRDMNAPEIDPNYYTIAVVGLPNRVVGNDVERFENTLKGQAELKVEGRKSIRSSSARALPRDEGLVILFLFKKDLLSNKDQPISQHDGRVVFDAKIGVFKVSQSFVLQEMVYADRLEL